MRTGTVPFFGFVVVLDIVFLVLNVPGQCLALEDFSLGLERGSGRHLHC